MSNLLKNKFVTVALSAVFVLLAVVAVAPKSTHAASCVFTGPLKVGSSGAEVTCLQSYLIGAGFSIPAGATGYFGSQTQAAVMAWQSAHNIMPAAGYFGPISQGVYATLGGGTGSLPAGCTSTSGYSTTTGAPCNSGGSLPAGCAPGALFSSTTGMSCTGGTSGSTGGLAGTDGSISDTNMLSQYSNEDVGENESDVKVMGFEIEASNDGDIALKSIKLTFDSTGNLGSDHLDDYIDGVSVWMDSTKIGSASADDFSEDSNGIYSKTITLSNAIVRADDTEKFYVSVDAVSNLDSGDIGTNDSWTVGVNNIRFMDGSGVTTTETASNGGTIDSTAGTGFGWDAANDGVGIDFVTFSTAADTELKISTDSDSPEAGIVVVDSSDETDDVVLLQGHLKLEGDSDATIDSFPVTLTTSGATDLDEITGSLTLVIDGNEYSESVSTSTLTTASVTFDNLDFDLSAGDTVDFEVRADINDIEVGYFEEGDMLKADVTSTNRNQMDVENEEGDQLSDSTEKSGTATGEYQEFRTQGIALTLVSTSAESSNDTGATNDTGTFKIKFKVTAVGGDVYLATTATTGDGYVYTVDYAGVTTTIGVSAVITNTTDTDLTSGQNWLIEEGQSETLELTVSKVNTALSQPTAGLFRANLTGVLWDDDDTGAVAPDNTYSSNLDEFHTSYVSLN